jgi:hypothetical protein
VALPQAEVALFSAKLADFSRGSLQLLRLTNNPHLIFLHIKGSARDAFSRHNPNRWTAGHLILGDNDPPGINSPDISRWCGACVYPDLFRCPGDRLLLWWPNRREKGELKSREGFLIVVLFWTVLGSVGAPFIFSEQPNLTITDAFLNPSPV